MMISTFTSVEELSLLIWDVFMSSFVFSEAFRIFLTSTTQSQASDLGRGLE